MKSKYIIATLCVLLLFLTANTYRLHSKIKEQSKLSEKQTRAMDSLRAIIKNEQIQGQLMSEKAHLVISKSQHQADSLRKIK